MRNEGRVESGVKRKQLGLKSYYKIIVELGKVRISLPVALSALTGYVMFTGELNSQGWLLALGVFLCRVVQEHSITGRKAPLMHKCHVRKTGRFLQEK